jgi:hypothetical protein
MHICYLPTLFLFHSETLEDHQSVIDKELAQTKGSIGKLVVCM